MLYNLIDSSLEIRRNILNIRKMSRYSIDVNLFQNNKINLVSSVSLVPGDIFELPPDGNAIPCDCILLSGSVIVNEAMLTGESLLLLKHIYPFRKKGLIMKLIQSICFFLELKLYKKDLKIKSQFYVYAIQQDLIQ